MEIAVHPEIHTYSGGLGVLAGDTARSAADLNLPMVFITLLSRDGYVRQEIGDQGNQINKPNPWRPEKWASPLPAMVAVSIEGRQVWIRPWLYLLTCPIGNTVPVLLLDTDLDQNSAEDRQITDRLYGGDGAHRLKQEIVLGIGGALLLRALGFSVRTYHLNEGHAALLALQLLRDTRRSGDLSTPSLYDRNSVREQCVFTTHTPVEAGFDRFDYGLVYRLLGDFFDLTELKALAGEDRLNMTRLALNLSGYVNGVARRHAETASNLFPGYQIRSITNGVHVHTWLQADLARLLQAKLPNWAHEPEVIALADQIPDHEIWAAHQAAKVRLLDLVRQTSGIELRLDVPLIGFARRMTSYKRPNLLFTDMDRLRQIAHEQPFQVVLARLVQRGTSSPHPRSGGCNPDGVPARVRHKPRKDTRIRGRHLAEYAATATGSLRNQRDEGGAQRRTEPERAGWLVGGGLRRRRHRLGNRRQPAGPGGCRGALSQARGGRPATLSSRPRSLDLDDETVNQQDRPGLQQPAHDASLRNRSVHALSEPSPSLSLTWIKIRQAVACHRDGWPTKKDRRAKRSAPWHPRSSERRV